MSASQQSRVLLVEDSRSLARAYEHYLRDEPCEVTIAETGGAALAEMARTRFAAELLDLRLPDMDGMDILKQLRDREAPPPVIVITAHGSINLAVEATRLGAFDFLVKPFNAERLVFTLRNATKRQRLAL